MSFRIPFPVGSKKLALNDGDRGKSRSTGVLNMIKKKLGMISESDDGEDIIVFEVDTEESLEDDDEDIELCEVDPSELNCEDIDFDGASSNCIKTKPNIRIKLNAKAIAVSAIKRPRKLRVPACKGVGLNHRFSLIQNKIMKRHINPHFAMLGVLKNRPSVFARVGYMYFLQTNEKEKDLLNKISTIAARLAKLQGSEKIDIPQYWIRQQEYWSQKLGWRKKDPYEVMPNRQELDREIDEYMGRLVKVLQNCEEELEQWEQGCPQKLVPEMVAAKPQPEPDLPPKCDLRDYLRKSRNLSLASVASPRAKKLKLDKLVAGQFDDKEYEESFATKSDLDSELDEYMSSLVTSLAKGSFLSPPDVMQSMMIASQQQLMRRASSSNSVLQASPIHGGSVSGSPSDRSSMHSNSSKVGKLETPPELPAEETVESHVFENSSNKEEDDVASVASLPVISPKKPPEKTNNRKTRSKRSSTSWLNILNPSYKSRSEEFKKLFVDSVPLNERLVVDYSCALQKEILVHGRVYLSLNYFCFYANIFKWETSVVIKCRDITSLTKANTARVIPNAIQLETGTGEKYILTSFAARDKTYVMMFRIWQNALLGQQMSSAELWSWVHYSYGDDLGFSSEEEEEAKDHPLNFRDDILLTLKSPSTLPVPNISDSTSSEDNGSFLKLDCDGGIEMQIIDRNRIRMNPIETAETIGLKNDIYAPDLCQQPGDISEDTPASTTKKDRISKSAITCTCIKHEGKELVKETFQVPPDTLFSLIFTDSAFYRALLESRKTCNITLLPWTETVDPEEESAADGPAVGALKLRQLTYTVTVNHALAKSAHTKETQYLHKSVPGELFVVKSEATNTGIPYCDTFVVRSHWCITRGKSENESNFLVHSEVIFKKNNWSFNLIKPMIEKSTNQGIADYHQDCAAALRTYANDGTLESLELSGQTSRSRSKSNSLDRGGSLNNSSRFHHLHHEDITENETASMAICSDTAGSDNLKASRRFSHARTGSSSHLRKDTASTSTTDETFLLKVILVILLILFISNIMLYVQLWKLEAVAKDYDTLFATGEDDAAGSAASAATTEIPSQASLEKWKQVLSKAVKLIQVMEKKLLDVGDNLKDEL